MKSITHQPFVAQVISHLNRPGRVGARLLIFPTRLSIDYFESFLNRAKIQNGVTYLTLHQLMLAHSSLKPLSTLALLSRLYRLTHQLLNTQESFEQFYGWGVKLLEDFNDIDTHLVDGAELFAALMQQKKKTMDAFVEQDPLDALKNAKTLSLFPQKEALLFWQQLPLLYQSFRDHLIKKREGYQGLCYRMAHPLPDLMATYQELIFVGFNWLTPTQEQFIKKCKAVVSATFFWDVDSHYLDNPINPAGYYLRKHSKWVEQSFTDFTYLNDPHKKVFLIETASIVQQVQAVVAALQEKTADGAPRFLPNQTAIVVSGSDLLIPLLDQLAALSIPLHFRLDYPFGATVIFTLLERLVQLWETSMDQSKKIYMVDVLALCYPFVQGAMQAEGIGQPLIKDGAPFWETDLWLNRSHKALLPYLQETLTYIDSHFIETGSLFLALNKSALGHLLAYIDGLVVAVHNCSRAFVLNGIKQSSVQLHRDNPLTGLYIVEVTASYNLDFEHVFFLHMNEGCFPALIHNDSFVSYDLRSTFGLSLLAKVAEYRTAYGFYRLLQRAQHIHCYYAKKNSLDVDNEMSRLLIQLTFDSTLNITSSHQSMHLLVSSAPTISIEKDHQVMQLLSKFLVKEIGTTSSLTPSALISYLACPLQFYFRYLLQLKQTVLPKEATEALQLGTLFHQVMAKCYEPFVGKEVDKAAVMQLKATIKIKIEAAIAAQRSALSSPILLHALLEKLLERMLDLDGSDKPFTILGVEVAIKQSIALDIDGAPRVSLSGVVDRIDKQAHLIRIIDYKTGLSNGKIGSIDGLFDRANIKKNKAIFQIFLYAWLFTSLHGRYHQVMPYLIPIQELFLADYKPGIFIQASCHGKKYQRIEDSMAYPFEVGLKTLLLEIFDPAIPFVQTEDHEICSYCPYVRICQRD